MVWRTLPWVAAIHAQRGLANDAAMTTGIDTYSAGCGRAAGTGTVGAALIFANSSSAQIE